ncbi:hypothetical protein BBF96_06995 [Anoxybacter fermentans]|uniref:DUF502 domain-containing protein n=1 Tax=Anoxybacter fermentans TaxID=1323375 RepID=A0A3S9SXX7_9FIRM|nr:DUF502 domain-containing protein [Anoxybacter fermentans]AZR73151.1 hypothetical protein BBF96_06995 [Anoxybacter fermentans]
MLRKIRNYFITGLIVLLPIVATVYIIFAIFSTLDRVVRPVIQIIFGREIYGLGVVLSLALIIFAGIFAKNVLGRRLIALSEWLMVRIPVVKQIYITVKQIIDTVFNQTTTTAFKQVVMIEYPRKGVYQLGFVTGHGIREVQERTGVEVMNIFIPTTPNPTSGMLVLVPKEDVIYLNITIEEGLKLILSGGVLVPDWKNRIKES